MPAHDLPYFGLAGGQNAEASSVVKAFGLARSRETASPVACCCGQGTTGGSSRAAGDAGQVPRCRAGAARVRRWWQVARLPAPGPPDLACAFHRQGRAGPSPPELPAWPGGSGALGGQLPSQLPGAGSR